MWLLKFFMIILLVLCISADPIDIKNYEFGEGKIKPFKNRATKSSADEVLSYRLPNNSIPLSYDITITTDIDENIFDFSGNVKIHVKIVEPTQTITLHYRKIEIERINILTSNGLFPIVLDAIYDLVESHDFLVIKLPTSVEPDTQYLIDISYHGELREDAAGFYRGYYYEDEELTTQKWYAATQFQIDDARHAFPCYDEPGIRAVMKLTIIHGKSFTALSSTEVIEKIDNGDHYVTKFAPTPVMQTYTLAFIVSDFEYVNTTGFSRVPQRIFGEPVAIRRGDGDFAASIVGPVLQKFEDLLKVDYPLSKMDHAALSVTGLGAMENFGLITYTDTFLLLNPIFTGAYKIIMKNLITTMIIHEYAHQWFGNILSPKWWSYTWLNEGFAVFFQFYIIDKMYPDQEYMNSFAILKNRLIYDDSNSLWSLNHYTDLPNELSKKFDYVSYNKGAVILKMYMEILGEDVFFDALNIYIRSNLMQAVEPADLHNAFQEAYDLAYPENTLHFGDIMSTWEDQAGYPLISITLSGSNFTFSQRRYLNNNGELYAVPITIATQSHPNFSVKTPMFWLSFQSLTIPQSSLGYNPNDWMIVNLDNVGYYRVDYDPVLWKAIIRQLNENYTVINEVNRAMLHSELYLGFLDSGRVTASNALGIINYLDNENYYYSWEYADNTINELNINLFGTTVYNHFLAMLLKITRPHIERLGYDDVDNEDFDLTKFRGIVRRYNCIANDVKCLAKDYNKLIEFRQEQGDNYFDFCNAFKIVDNETFVDILDGITRNQIDFKTDYLSSIGCSLSHKNLEKLLEAILYDENWSESWEKEFAMQEMITKNSLGLEKALNFIDEHYRNLTNIFDGYLFVLHTMSSELKEEHMVTQYKMILENLFFIGEIESTYINYLMKIVQDNQGWMNKYYLDVKLFFGFEQSTTTTQPTPQEPTKTSNQQTTKTSTQQPTITTTDKGNGGISKVMSISLILVCLLINFRGI